MHWLTRAAARAGIQGAEAISLPPDTTLPDAWEIVARTLGMTQMDLAQRIAPAFGLEVASIEMADPMARLVLPEQMARRFQVLPLSADDRSVVVASGDPTNLDLEQALSFATGRRASLRLAPPSAIEEAFLTGYQEGERAIDGLLERVDEELAEAVRVIDEDEPEKVGAHEVESAPVVKLANLILRDAVAQGASDIHIEPGQKVGTVRFRIDGVMRKHMQLPLAALSRVVSRIKVLGRLDIANRIVPQDGRTRVLIERRTYDLRISTVPTREAEKVVIRVLRPESAKRIEQLSYPVREAERLRQLLGTRDGILVVTGPTGSGKTTTLYAALTEVATEAVNVTTVEDPVEYELPGITQIQVEPRRGVTFASALRAILRQDPDVIFVGEIRDPETAQIAVQAAMTGHLVLATLHTNDAMSVVARLTDLGLDLPSIAATLRGVVAQRLVRRVCADCVQPVDGSLTSEEERLSDYFGLTPTVRAIGCRKCANTGYRGRVPIAEAAIMTGALAEHVAHGASAGALQRAAVGAGMRTLRASALERVRAGETTLQEVERVLGERGDDMLMQTRAPRVLVVDDDANWRANARLLFEGTGYAIREETSMPSARARVASGEGFELVVARPAVLGDAALGGDAAADANEPAVASALRLLSG
jgi:type IV pilus assembly protein PilB